MFNVNAQFNTLKFNVAPFLQYANTMLEGIGTVYPFASIEAVGASDMEGRGTLIFTVSIGGASYMSGVGSVVVIPRKELYGLVPLEGIGTLTISGNKYEVKSITFTGDFGIGDTVKIDMDKFTVLLNGQNTISSMSGDFFNLLNGENSVTYTDTAGTRSVMIIFEYRDRWL